MRNAGLQNRFPESVRLQWDRWYACMLCSFNRFDALHHIMSPTMRDYIDGRHNESVFNSCPIHNYKHPSSSQLKEKGFEGFGVDENCHIGNESYLHKREVFSELLNKVFNALIFEKGYRPNELDKEFLRKYIQFYGEQEQKTIEAFITG